MIFADRFRAMARLFIAGVVLTVPFACKKAIPPEERALRIQLAREIRHHSYDKAVPMARRLTELTPQDNSVWKRLVQAQFGLQDFDGATRTLIQWRQTVRAPSPRLDEYEGDIAHE